MLACKYSEEVKCDPLALENKNMVSCGSDFAIIYFISFYVLCSFLVSTYLESNLYFQYRNLGSVIQNLRKLLANVILKFLS